MSSYELKQLDRAISLLREIRHQDFVTDIAWDEKLCRIWIKKVEKLLAEVKHEQ